MTEEDLRELEEQPEQSLEEKLHELEELKHRQEQYDNEWIKFVGDLAKNESVKYIVTFIQSQDWTDRQRKKIMAYARIQLSREFSLAYLVNRQDYIGAIDSKALVDCDLPLGMTRFDLTPEYNLLIGMIDQHFRNQLSRSKGGHLLGKIGLNRHEIITEERTRDKGMGFKDKVMDRFGVGGE